MQTGYVIVEGKECYYELVEMLELKLKKSNFRKIIDGMLFFMEDYSVMNSSDLLVVVRVQKLSSNNDTCEIEIVTGGGGDGLLSLTFGNEKRRVKHVLDIVESFCKAKRFSISYP